ncbi:MAG: hypothetical protein PHW04_17800 [Candidatus Wallbacteria bacterium]|nr:hypothetical protein [Candidatus Wallbacteria bacterium]
MKWTKGLAVNIMAVTVFMLSCAAASAENINCKRADLLMAKAGGTTSIEYIIGFTYNGAEMDYKWKEQQEVSGEQISVEQQKIIIRFISRLQTSKDALATIVADKTGFSKAGIKILYRKVIVRYPDRLWVEYLDNAEVIHHDPDGLVYTGQIDSLMQELLDHPELMED